MENCGMEKAKNLTPRATTLDERLDEREKDLAESLEAVKEVKQILWEQPKISRLLELLQRLCIR